MKESIAKTMGCLAGVLLLAGCGEATEPEARPQTSYEYEAPDQTVETDHYRLTCEEVTCKGEAEVSTSFLELQGNTLESVDCSWRCTRYGGREEVRLSLEFQSYKGGCWEKTYESTDEPFSLRDCE